MRPTYGADQHHRVRARSKGLLPPGPLVVADHDGDSRLVRLRHVQNLLGLLDLLGVRPDRLDTLVDEEPGPAGESARSDEEDEKEPEEDAAEDPDRAPPPAAVAGHRT
jgi:hypothetical protein